MRKDLFDVLDKFYKNKIDNVDPEAQRYVERSIIEGKQDGKIVFSFIMKNLNIDFYQRVTFGRRNKI
jgi:hypothetical protein